MHGVEDDEHQRPSSARGVWEAVWPALEDLVGEARSALASHLRDAILFARRLAGSEGCEAGELVIGRTLLRVECPLRCRPPATEERALRDLFGADTPLARILVLRDRGVDPPLLESMLVADPARGVWISTEPELGPALLRDIGTLETFFWSLIADRRS